MPTRARSSRLPRDSNSGAAAMASARSAPLPAPLKRAAPARRPNRPLPAWSQACPTALRLCPATSQHRLQERSSRATHISHLRCRHFPRRSYHRPRLSTKQEPPTRGLLSSGSDYTLRFKPLCAATDSGSPALAPSLPRSETSAPALPPPLPATAGPKAATLRMPAPAM